MNYCKMAAKKPLLLILFLTLLINVQAQQLKKMEYFFDTDPGFGKGTQLVLPAKKGVDSTLDFDISSLTNGLHFVYVRGQDTSGNWGLDYNATFIKSTGGIEGGTANYVTKIEYFFDTDPGIGKATPVVTSPNKTVDSTFPFNVSQLSNGLHTLYVRALDINQNWGLAYNSSFIKQIGDDSMLTITKLEYFLDVDPGFGNGTALPVTEAAAIDQTFNFDVTFGSATTRTLYIRAQDSRGSWSLLYDTILTAGTLPLLITNFSGQYIKGGNELSATLADAINVQTVELDRSADGIHFSYLGDMAVAPLINGTHLYVDQSPYDGKNYYRLRIIDNDGNVNFSGVVLLDNAGALKATVYPNPFVNSVQLQFTNASAGNYYITITDAAGKRVQASQLSLTQGNRAVTVPVSGNAKGVYFVEVKDASGNTVLSQKIVRL